ncbi:LytTR family DNA-binding domain-containing protein [Clostridium sp. A1-XYC3]|uniref:Stage 0 sporulation protein A homolog n=1 Tax=Clostridium tanneri TaxID=3037988 RepID=A0ABU4JRD6_9CLOT|nr:LytTR family DNA-binding domain-containing protein [Clostridium sp. A1-XYC3]MDW8800704.1 LytTR family DNA-binding domain-containing protein [Clostridium sp. A1-XYC3]
MTNILVAEDDIIQRENLIKMIKEADINTNIYEADSKEEALKISEEAWIDFFYIDVALRNSSGIELALELRVLEKYKFSWIVFITTNINYMIKAFKEIHCYDYIMKPYDKDQVISITRQLISGSHKLIPLKNKDRYVVFEIQKGITVKINVNEIVFIEVSFRKLKLHTKMGLYELKRLALNKALEMIDSENIIQSHKSFAVNTDFISKIESVSPKQWEISFKGYKDKALLSYNFKNVVMEKFKQ